MDFYTNVAIGGSKILYRGYERGVRVTKKFPFSPKLYVPTNDPTAEWRTVDGIKLAPIEFDSMWDAKNFCKQYKGVSNYKIYGNTDFKYVFIEEEFPDDISYQLSKIRITNIDIETSMRSGQTVAEMLKNPIEEITAITFKRDGKYYTFGCGDYTPTAPDVVYRKSKNEMEMLADFVDVWSRDYPDIITGWNIDFFDVPYLVNRITRLFDEDYAKKLSPWKRFSERFVNILGTDHQTFTIVGIASLDYLQLYKKFAPNPNQERYSLNWISHIEIGEQKEDYSTYRNLDEFREKDYQGFIDYNIKDVRLVDKLDAKMQLIPMAIATAYDAKCNFDDVFSQVRMWDTIIYRHLNSQKIAIPPKVDRDKVRQYQGGYVKTPIVGMHHWCASFDVASLYPSLIIQYNISPDTLIEGSHSPVMVNGLLLREHDLSSEKYCVAANGHHFAIDKQGFLPQILNKMLKDRKRFKQAQLAAEAQLEAVKREIHRRETIEE